MRGGCADTRISPPELSTEKVLPLSKYERIPTVIRDGIRSIDGPILWSGLIFLSKKEWYRGDFAFASYIEVKVFCIHRFFYTEKDVYIECLTVLKC